MTPMRIDGRKIGDGAPVYIVAEIGAGFDPADPKDSVNQLIRAAKAAGADAVKLQIYRPDDLTCPGLEPLTEGPWANQTLWDIYSACALPEEHLLGWFNMARQTGITMFASIFHPRLVPFLESVKCPAYKVASAEINHHELLWAIARTGKPVILSAGMASDEELYSAWSVFSEDAAVLHCVPEYPAATQHCNLNQITRLQKIFGENYVGLSDHSKPHFIGQMAVAEGAVIIEKHIALDGSYDASFGLRPWAFARFVKAIRAAEDALQAPTMPKPGMQGLKRSVRAVKPIAAGEKLRLNRNIKVLRPSGGADPLTVHLLNGATVKTTLQVGDPVNHGDVEEAKTS